METFNNETIRGLLASSLRTASVGETGWHDRGEGPGSTEGDYIDWLQNVPFGSSWDSGLRLRL